MNFLTNKQFYPTFWVQFFGALNSNVIKNAFIILLTFKLVSFDASHLVVLAGALFILPFFLFSALAGDFADKYPKNVLTQKLKILELIITSLGAIGFITTSPVLLFICIFLMGTQAAFYGPIKYSILPELLEESKLIKANALVEVGTFLAILAGTILGGTLISLSYGEYIVSGVCISLSLAGLFFTKKIPVLSPINSQTKISLNIIKSNQKNFKIVKPQKNVFLTILGISWFWLLGSVLLSLFPVLVKTYLMGQESIVTLFLSIFCVGIACGSIVCEKMSKTHLELGLVPLASIGLVAFLVDFYFSLSAYTQPGAPLSVSEFLAHSSGLRIVADLFFIALCSGMYNVPLYSYLQIRTKREERSQIIAATNIMNALFMVIGSLLLSSFFALELSFPSIILTMAVMSLAVAIYIYTLMPEFLWRFACVVLTKVVYSFKTVRLEPISPDKAMVIVANHVSFVDWLLIAAAVNRPVRFVMDHKIYNNILLKFIFKSVNAIPIAPQKVNNEIYEKAFQEIKKTLDEDGIVCIFPEGKISKDGTLNPYKAGVETILKQSPRVDVLPLVIKNMYGSFFSRVHKERAFSKPSLLIKNFRKSVTVEGLPVVSNSLVTAKKLEEMTQVSLEN